MLNANREIAGAFPQRLSLTTSTVAAFFGLFSLIATGLIWARFGVDIPIWDLARFLPVIETAITQGLFAPALADWVSLHANAHRVLEVKALMYIDYRFFRGNNHVIYFSSAISILVAAYVYLKAATASLKDFRGYSLFITGITLSALCGPVMYWTFINPTCSTWYFNITFSAAGMWILVDRGRQMTPGAAMAVGMLGMAAAFSNFSGLLFCLIAPVIAFLVRSPYWWHLAIGSIAFCAAYVSGIDVSGDSLENSEQFMQAMAERFQQRPELLGGNAWFYQSVDAVKQVVVGTCMLLGFPLSTNAPWLAGVIVALSIVMLGLFWLQFILNFRDEQKGYNASTVFFIGMATLQLGIAASIYLGRVGIYEPTALRYQSLTATYWLSLAFLVLIEVRLRRGAWVPIGMAIMATGAIAFNLHSTNASLGMLDSAYHQYHKEKILHQLGLATQVPSHRWRKSWVQHVDFVSPYNPLPIDREALSINAGGDSTEPCRQLNVHRGRYVSETIQVIKVQLPAPADASDTGMYIVGPRGLQGILYPEPPDALWVSDIHRATRQWRGFFTPGDRSDHYELVMDNAGLLSRCSLSMP